MSAAIALTLEKAIHIDGTGRMSAVIRWPETVHALHMLRVSYEASILDREMYTSYEVGQMLARYDDTGVRQ